MPRNLLVAVFFLFSVTAANAQDKHDHDGHDHGKPKKTNAKKDTAQKAPVAQPLKDTVPVKKTQPHADDHQHNVEVKKPQASDGHAGHDHGAAEEDEHGDHGAMNMSHAFSLNLPMNRNGSGTAWLPDNSPMYGYMFHKNKWMYMVHGNVFFRYNKQDVFNTGSRGGSKFDIPNMFMLMGQRQVGMKGLFHFSSMLSLDPITVGGAGYPLLFQTGETYKGKPLVDRQHPHDFISELSVSYAHAISKSSDVFLYLGYPGEPALGPVAFVHRPSGLVNPDAPLTHHWVDATHITFGVATLGYRAGKFKIEGSSFTGREPGENRYSFDKPRFDSWSGRLSYNPSAKWAMQVSHGFIKQPEEAHPDEDVNRTSASVIYSHRGFGESFTNISAVWGLNKVKDNHGENGFLLEAAKQGRKWTRYGRYEFVQKSSEELVLDETEFDHHALFGVHAVTGGLSYDILTIGKTKFALGGQFTVFNPDKALRNLYGDMPLAAQVYLRINPRAMSERYGSLRLVQ